MAKQNSLILSLQLSHELLRLIAEIDEFKGRWQALQTLSPERPCEGDEQLKIAW